jgi:hypothetical protein
MAWRHIREDHSLNTVYMKPSNLMPLLLFGGTEENGDEHQAG